LTSRSRRNGSACQTEKKRWLAGATSLSISSSMSRELILLRST
jgi:hypothetical protein